MANFFGRSKKDRLTGHSHVDYSRSIHFIPEQLTDANTNKDPSLFDTVVSSPPKIDKTRTVVPPNNTPNEVGASSASRNYGCDTLSDVELQGERVYSTDDLQIDVRTDLRPRSLSSEHSGSSPSILLEVANMYLDSQLRDQESLVSKLVDYDIEDTGQDMTPLKPIAPPIDPPAKQSTAQNITNESLKPNINVQRSLQDEFSYGPFIRVVVLRRLKRQQNGITKSKKLDAKRVSRSMSRSSSSSSLSSLTDFEQQWNRILQSLPEDKKTAIDAIFKKYSTENQKSKPLYNGLH